MGVIIGFFMYPFYARKAMERTWSPPIRYYPRADSAISYDFVARRDILYHEPGSESVWDSKYEEISEGEGEISGSVFIDDEPAAGLNIALILAPGKKTKTVTTTEDGSYRITVPKGSYYFNGIAIYNRAEQIEGKICVNKLSQGIFRLFSKPLDETGQTLEELDKLIEKYGEKKGLEKMAELLPNTFDNKFQFSVSDKPFAFPPFFYRDPVRIVTPTDGGTVELEKLRFAWVPCPGAQSYSINVFLVERVGNTTSYHPVLSCGNLTKTDITYDELQKKIETVVEFSSENMHRSSNKLRKGNTYGFRILAYGENQEPRSASSEFGFVSFFLK